MAEKPQDTDDIIVAAEVDPGDLPEPAPAPSMARAGGSIRSINRDTHVGTSRQRPYDAYEEAVGFRRGGGPTDQMLAAAGAEQDENGAWFRWVPSQGAKRRVVNPDGTVSYEYDEEKRYVAPSPGEAYAQQGTHDAYVPGVGWLRNGIKPEVEHPDNRGDGSGVVTERRTRTEAMSADEQAAIQAAAQGNALRTGGTLPFGAPAQPRQASPEPAPKAEKKEGR